MSLGGQSLGDDAKYRPVGMRIKTCSGECTFKRVTSNTDHIVLMYAKDHLFSYDRVHTTAHGSVHANKSFLAKHMKHGQMLITLSWGEDPSDLDLYVVAPAKHGVTEIGGGKPQVSSQLDSQAEKEGETINWMNKGEKDKYPYTVL